MSIDERWIVTLKGKAYPLWAGVLDAATKAGLKTLTVQVLQYPTADNGQLAVVEATGTFDDGRVFTDIGDCSPQSTSAHLAAASLRIASTRAKGRALRDALNVGQTMFEELGDSDEAEHEPSRPRPEPARAAAAAPESNGKSGALACETCGKALTQGQAEMSKRALGGRLLCPQHQREEAQR